MKHKRKIKKTTRWIKASDEEDDEDEKNDCIIDTKNFKFKLIKIYINLSP